MCAGHVINAFVKYKGVSWRIAYVIQGRRYAPDMTKGMLSIKEVDELVRSHKACKKRRDADRIKCIILMHKGWSYSMITEALLLDETTARNYKKLYKAGGMGSLLQNNHLGRVSLLTGEQKSALYEHLCENPYQESVEIAVYVDLTFGVRYSTSGIVSLLHSINMSYKKPKVVPAKADREAQAAFIKLYKNAKETDTPIYFMDGTHPTHNSMPAYGWIPKGKDLELKSNSGRSRININGAINIKTMDGVFDFTDSVNAQSTVSLLEAINKKHRYDDLVWVICDNARYYRSEIVREWLEDHPRVELVFLPAYSPNLNLIERLWKFFKKKTMYNRYYETFDDYKEAVYQFFRDLKVHRKGLKRLLTDNFQLFSG